MLYKERLLTPGPTPIPDAVLQAMQVGHLHHRSDEFRKFYRSAINGMKWLLDWPNDPVLLTCSGTGGMEAALGNVSKRGDTMIFVNGGEFGDRWGKIGKTLGLSGVEIKVKHGLAPTESEVREACQKNPSATTFCIQHCESSTTALYPLESLLPVVRSILPKAMIIVDGISACGAVPLPKDRSLIDIYIAGSQKALMCPAGVSVVALTDAAWKRVEETPRTSLYFDLLSQRTTAAKDDAAWTPATTIIIGLTKAIDLIREEGKENVILRHQLLSKMACAGAEALALKRLAPDFPSPTLTGVYAPSGIDAEALRTTLRTRYGFQLVGGQGSLKGQIIRIGHMGYVDPIDLVGVLSALELSIVNLGGNCNVGQLLKPHSQSLRIIMPVNKSERAIIVEKEFRRIQGDICAGLEALDGTATFLTDPWERKDLDGSNGGGGLTRVLTDGAIFEKAGVNFSAVHGTMGGEFASKLGGPNGDVPFFASGVSLVLHPRSPMIPTTHANWRYLEVGNAAWFGGGSDLTPYYLFEEDAAHFHQILKSVCDKHDKEYYPRFKKWCDEYFYLPHRQEARGIGGIFFDYIGRDSQVDYDAVCKFVTELGDSFIPQYAPIVDRRRHTSYGERERDFQTMRRGRYVEFNLLYDRGTHFGLQTAGRIESILMSLPPVVRWEYNPKCDDGSPEAKLLEVVRCPREWV